MIWDKAVECASRDELRNLQNHRLKEMIARVRRTAFYRESETHAINPETVTIDHLQEMCFTTKRDLRRFYPYGMFTVAAEEIVELHASSGTTGKLTVVGYTRDDIKIWMTAMARSMTAAGVGQSDTVQNAFRALLMWTNAAADESHRRAHRRYVDRCRGQLLSVTGGKSGSRRGRNQWPISDMAMNRGCARSHRSAD
jgi:phenylacetate-coenzyme A ligase PaaK-like adenylate-forming protein